MNCTYCGSDSLEILKSKGKKTKEFLFKCSDCGSIFRETIEEGKPLDCRVVVSEFERSHKTFIPLYEDEILQTGDIIQVEGREAQITSLENKRGGRVKECLVGELNTIWASYIDIPVRVGVSVDFGGEILSKKVEVGPDFEFVIGDVIKMGKLIFKINSLKTVERKMRRGFAQAAVTKRVYGKPVDDKKYKYDLSPKVL